MIRIKIQETKNYIIDIKEEDMEDYLENIYQCDLISDEKEPNDDIKLCLLDEVNDKLYYIADTYDYNTNKEIEYDTYAMKKLFNKVLAKYEEYVNETEKTFRELEEKGVLKRI